MSRQPFKHRQIPSTKDTGALVVQQAGKENASPITGDVTKIVANIERKDFKSRVSVRKFSSPSLLQANIPRRRELPTPINLLSSFQRVGYKRKIQNNTLRSIISRVDPQQSREQISTPKFKNYAQLPANLVFRDRVSGSRISGAVTSIRTINFGSLPAKRLPIKKSASKSRASSKALNGRLAKPELRYSRPTLVNGLRSSSLNFDSPYSFFLSPQDSFKDNHLHFKSSGCSLPASLHSNKSVLIQPLDQNFIASSSLRGSPNPEDEIKVLKASLKKLKIILRSSNLKDTSPAIIDPEEAILDKIDKIDKIENQLNALDESRDSQFSRGSSNPEVEIKVLTASLKQLQIILRSLKLTDTNPAIIDFQEHNRSDEINKIKSEIDNLRQELEIIERSLKTYSSGKPNKNRQDQDIFKLDPKKLLDQFDSPLNEKIVSTYEKDTDSISCSKKFQNHLFYRVRKVHQIDKLFKPNQDQNPSSTILPTHSEDFNCTRISINQSFFSNLRKGKGENEEGNEEGNESAIDKEIIKGIKDTWQLSTNSNQEIKSQELSKLDQQKIIYYVLIAKMINGLSSKSHRDKANALINKLNQGSNLQLDFLEACKFSNLFQVKMAEIGFKTGNLNTKKELVGMRLKRIPQNILQKITQEFSDKESGFKSSIHESKEDGSDLNQAINNVSKSYNQVFTASQLSC